MKGNVNKHACSDFPLWVSLKKKKGKKLLKKLPKKIIKKKKNLPKAVKKIVVNRHLIVLVSTKYPLTQPIQKN